jgi:predicted transcriptional regulator
VTEEKNRQDAEMIELTADIVAAFVQNNAVPVAGLPVLFFSVNSALVSLEKPAVVDQPTQIPAVNLKRSVFLDTSFPWKMGASSSR